MPQVLLDDPQIHAAVDQVHTARVTEGMRMPLHAQDLFAEAVHHAPETIDADRRPSFVDEHQARRTSVLSLVAFQSTHRAALKRVRTIETALDAIHTQLMRDQVDGRPTQGHQLRDPQTMFEGETNHECIAPAVTLMMHCPTYQAVNLIPGQVLTASSGVIGCSILNCPGFSGWEVIDG